MKKILFTSLIFLSLFLLTACDNNGLKPTSSQTEPNQEAETFNDSQWLDYQNEKYAYQIKYMTDWHKQSDDEPPYPPPPAGMIFSKKWDDKKLFFCNFSILSSDLIDNIDGEIDILSTDPKYFKGTGKINNIDSITFESDQNTTVNGISALNYGLTHYVKNMNKSYRISYGGMLSNAEDMKDCKAICEKMLSSFVFAK
jgi:hypothetical protein